MFINTHWLRGAFAFTMLSACVPTAAPPVGDADRLSDDRIAELASAGHIELNLGDGRDDPSVIEDAESLLLGAIDGMPALDFDVGHSIALTYLGKGRRAKMAPEPDPDTSSPTDVIEGVDAFNLSSGNEFRIVFGGGLLEAVGEYDAAHGLDLGTPAVESDEHAPTAPPPEGAEFSWSNGDDDRYRIYGFNATVTASAHRRLVQLGSGCSGTLVGPRHVVTAGHCLWSRSNGSWSDDFWVRAGANGTNERAQVFLNANNIPSGQVVWYYTPSQFRSTSGSTWGYDYGILTIPGRLGDQVGWMGRVTYSASSLQSAYVYRRGYPVCNHPRIDDPSPCSTNHLYGNSSDCSVGEYQSQDSSGWSRIVHHSCDASAGDSGSPLYVYYNGTPSVAAVHFFSHCETTATDDDCDGSWEDRPLGALRLTPQYRDLIGTFRSIFP